MVAAALLLAGCGQQPTPFKHPELTFDGAQQTDAAAKVAHGERLTRVLGCRGCHTPSLQGQQFYELYASNLTREVPKYSDKQLERLLRGGVHPAGRDLWGMPSEIFQHLTDADLLALTAYLRTLKPDGPPTGKPLPFEAETKKLIDAGEIMPAAAAVEKTRTLRPLDLGEDHALGRYITEVTCAECHGPKLEGHAGDTPDLTVAGGYTRAEFDTLMTRGVLPNNRKFKNPLMGEVARNRFSRLTPHERDELYAYLKARAERPQ
jgi:mono/diheme cytochrome c family protein